jgi:5-methyltetrahydropteroyltriglutamate--homocysteine methyltransferase
LGTLGTLLRLASHVDVATSCSLLHVPLDVTLERDLDPQITGWFAFARQKLDELIILVRGLARPGGRDAIAGELQVTREGSRE